MFTLKTDHHVIFQKDEQLILLICEGTWGGWNILLSSYFFEVNYKWVQFWFSAVFRLKFTGLWLVKYSVYF